MSKKHVEDYFNQICDDYHELVSTLNELQEQCETTVVPPEKIENLKHIIEPIKDNYERISYIMFLLNMPNKKEKKK